MIDLSPMGGVRVDPQQRRAWVQVARCLAPSTKIHSGTPWRPLPGMCPTPASVG